MGDECDGAVGVALELAEVALVLLAVLLQSFDVDVRSLTLQLAQKPLPHFRLSGLDLPCFQF